MFGSIHFGDLIKAMQHHCEMYPARIFSFIDHEYVRTLMELEWRSPTAITALVLRFEGRGSQL